MSDISKRVRFITLLDKIGYLIEMSTGSFCAIFFAGMAFVTIVAVFYRYVLNDPIQWSNEVARFLMLWTGFLAMNIAMRRNEHIRIDLVAKMLPPGISKVLDYLIDGLIGYFLVLLIIKGYYMTVSTMLTASAIPISMTWIYIAVPLGALLTLIQLLLNLINRILSLFGEIPDSIS